MIDRPCGTCGHSINVHVIDSKTRKRMGCSSWFGGRCGCKQYVKEDVVSEECPAGGEHCAHWFDGAPCCFCQLDGPQPEPAIVDVEIRDGLL